MKIMNTHLNGFKTYLDNNEKAVNTIIKYLRDVSKFMFFVGGEELSKNIVIQFKHHLEEKGYEIGSINTILSSVNAFLKFLDVPQYKVSLIRVQQQLYQSVDKELNEDEYFRLLTAAESNERLWLLIQTIASTGIRVSELKFVTVEAVKKGEFTVHLKGKVRKVMMPDDMRHLLLKYIEKRGYKTGPVFRTKNGTDLNRTYIWRSIKKLCLKTGIKSSKVFPHNLRKLFAFKVYSDTKDISKLADILGHSNINTTRIYIMTSGEQHRRILNRVGLTAINRHNKNNVASISGQ